MPVGDGSFKDRKAIEEVLLFMARTNGPKGG